MNESPATSALVFDPILPVAVIALAGVLMLALTVHAYLRLGTILSGGRRVVLLCFRLLGIGLVVVLLLQPSRRETLPPPNREHVTAVAIDSSGSMKQRDMEAGTRLDAAKRLLTDAGVVGGDGLPTNARLRLYQFGADAQAVRGSVLALEAAGASTRLHRTITTILQAQDGREAINALILLSDGHDHGLVNPAKTGAAARGRQVPIYAVALGKQGRVRDVSARISGYQPYCYVRQKARVSATLRLVGCEFETLNVQLLRGGQVTQTKRLNADEFQELSVEFEVVEPEIGQYEYEVRVQPLDGEVDSANNSAITYLNVIDQQIKMLVLEGDPYWDTTFLHRSLMRNEKFDVHVLIRYGKDKVRAIRKTATQEELRAPATLDQFAHYDVIVLGRGVDGLLDAGQLSLLEQYVKDRSGTVIFSRGRAFAASAAVGELEPVLWGDRKHERVRIDAAPDGRGLAAIRTLTEGSGGLEGLPDVFNGREASQVRTLTATLVQTAAEDGASGPAIVHRRYGGGQVLSVGVDGLWRWGLNAKIDGVNAPFDRFWDQLVLWLVAGRDIMPSRQFSFRPNSANVLLGEKVHFRLAMRQPDERIKSVPVTLLLGEKEVGRANLSTTQGEVSRLTGEFLPERVGRYRAQARLPDGTMEESRFIVFNENLEETEVTTDIGCLRRLCESSGGRLLEPRELGRLFEELNRDKMDATPKTLLKPIWNVAWVFYAATLWFGLDWFLRRRWGLC